MSIGTSGDSFRIPSGMTGLLFLLVVTVGCPSRETVVAPAPKAPVPVSPTPEPRIEVTNLVPLPARPFEIVERRRILSEPGPVNDISFSPDGTLAVLVTGGKAVVWNVQRSTALCTYSTSRPGGIRHGVFAPNAGGILLMGEEGPLVLATERSSEVLRRFPLEGAAHALPDPLGRFIAVSYRSDARIDLLSMETGAVEKSLDGAGPASRLALDSTGQTLASAGTGGVTVFEVASGTRIAKMAHEGVSDASFLPGSGLLMTVAPGEPGLVLWDPDTFDKVEAAISGYTNDLWAARAWRAIAHKALGPGVRAAAFSQEFALLAVLDGTSRVTLLDTRASDPESWTRLETVAPVGHPSEILTAAFSPDGKSLLTGGADQTLALWDVPPPLQRRSSAPLSRTSGRIALEHQLIGQLRTARRIHADLSGLDASLSERASGLSREVNANQEQLLREARESNIGSWEEAARDAGLGPRVQQVARLRASFVAAESIRREVQIGLDLVGTLERDSDRPVQLVRMLDVGELERLLIRNREKLAKADAVTRARDFPKLPGAPEPSLAGKAFVQPVL